MMTQGDDIAAFLCKHFKEDISQRPEFRLGFEALRRSELVKLAKVAGLDIKENLPKDFLVMQMNGWLMDGSFNDLIAQGASASGTANTDEAVFFQACKTEADYRAYLERYPAGAFAPLAKPRAGSDHGTSPVDVSVEDKPSPTPPADLHLLTYQELQKRGKSIGINVLHMKADELREQIAAVEARETKEAA